MLVFKMIFILFSPSEWFNFYYLTSETKKPGSDFCDHNAIFCLKLQDCESSYKLISAIRLR
jgi:hypothetical protein